MNKKPYSLHIWLIFVSIILLAANNVNPLFVSTTKDFSVDSNFGARTTFPIAIREQGCIWAQATWPTTSTAKTLALILNGPGNTSAYRRNDGESGVVLYYSATVNDIKKGTNWSISIANFGGGIAKGKITIEYPPSQTPCELKVIISRTRGKIDLNWVYTGKPFRGSFLIERSTDNRVWSVISICRKSAPTSSTTTSTSYSCSDTGLKSSATYYYRACAITSGSSCNINLNTTPVKSVKVP